MGSAFLFLGALMLNSTMLMSSDPAAIDAGCLQAMQGRWLTVRSEHNGDTYDPDWVRSIHTITTVNGIEIITRSPEELPQKSEFQSVAADGADCIVEQLMTNSIYHEGMRQQLRVRFSGSDQMTIVFGRYEENTAPTQFSAPSGSKYMLNVYERIRALNSQ